MIKCFIHIGMEKTGSTSIQWLLREHAKQLRRAGVEYPLGGSGRINHNFLAAAYIPPDSARFPRLARSGQARRPGYLEGYRARVLAQIAACNRVVLSGEHLFRLNSDEVSALKIDLEAVGVREARVFGILRSPASFYLSFVQQELKGSGALPSPHELFIPYAARTAGWLQHFECRFFEFEGLAKSDLGIVGTFVRQLEDFFGVDLSTLPRQFRPSNDSLSPEEMQLVQDFRRRWFPDDDGILNRATTRLVDYLRMHRDETWRKPILRSAVEAVLSERHNAEVGALAALTGVHLRAEPEVSSHEPVNPHHARDILTNFQPSLYERLLPKVRPSRFVGLGSRFADLASGLAKRSA